MKIKKNDGSYTYLCDFQVYDRKLKKIVECGFPATKHAYGEKHVCSMHSCNLTKAPPIRPNERNGKETPYIGVDTGMPGGDFSGDSIGA